MQENLFIEDHRLDCMIKLDFGKLTLISGANGVGKSSLIHLLKIHQKKYFAGHHPVFVDQFPLQPLNEISLSDTLKLFDGCRIEGLDLFTIVYKECENFKDIPIKNLSGGQNQLCKMAIALFVSGDIFVLDEPFQFLDQRNLDLVLKILQELKNSNKAILLVEHRKEIVQEIIDYTGLMHRNDQVIRIDYGH